MKNTRPRPWVCFSQTTLMAPGETSHRWRSHASCVSKGFPISDTAGHERHVRRLTSVTVHHEHIQRIHRKMYNHNQPQLTIGTTTINHNQLFFVSLRSHLCPNPLGLLPRCSPGWFQSPQRNSPGHSQQSVPEDTVQQNGFANEKHPAKQCKKV